MRSIPFETLQGGGERAYRPVSLGRGGLSGLIASGFATLMLWQQRAVERHQMRDLTDEMLRDIGYERAEVAREAAKPFWRA